MARPAVRPGLASPGPTSAAQPPPRQRGWRSNANNKFAMRVLRRCVCAAVQGCGDAVARLIGMLRQ